MFEIHLGDPIETTGMTLHDRGRLNEMLQERVAELVRRITRADDLGHRIMTPHDRCTIPELLHNAAAQFGDRLALRQPDRQGRSHVDLEPISSKPPKRLPAGLLSSASGRAITWRCARRRAPSFIWPIRAF